MSLNLKMDVKNLFDFLSSIQGNTIVSAPRRSGKTTAIKHNINTSKGINVFVVYKHGLSARVFGKGAYIYSDFFINDTCCRKKPDLLIVDDACFFEEKELSSIMSVSDNVIFVSTPKKGSAFNDLIKNSSEINSFSFMGGENEEFKKILSRDKYEEDVLGIVL